MKPSLFFDFTVDKQNNCILVTREFAAELDLVWEAWTNPEIIDQWWAPKPYVTKTKIMDFREGGMWLYSMTGPTGDVHWNRADYIRILHQISYTGLDSFCDENGNINSTLPSANWNVSFNSEGLHTTVSIKTTYKKLSDIEKIIEMGFKEGFSSALENLDMYIESQHKLKASLKKDRSTRVCTYLNFPGNTEEAFLFYKSVFRTEFIGNKIQRFGDIPPDPKNPPVADSIKNMVLHVELPITANHILMGTDAPKELGFTLIQGNNMHISLEPESREEAKRIFDELSVGGNITMPLEDMFFGSYFGSFTDKFGINWMLNFISKTN